MDDADKAAPLIDGTVRDGIEQARRAPMLQPKGTCWFCDEPVDAVRRFCDKECCESFEMEEEAIRRAGRR